MRRRAFLKFTGGVTVALSSGTSLLEPFLVHAANRQMNPFESISEKEVLKILFGGTHATPSYAVSIEAPLQSNGKGVPVKVKCEMDDVEVIAILTRYNRHPLNSVLRLQGADAYYSTRIRVERTSPIIAYVKAGNSVYFAAAEMKFSHGGFGTHLQ